MIDIVDYSGEFDKVFSAYSGKITELRTYYRTNPVIYVDINDLTPKLFDLLIKNPSELYKYATSSLIAKYNAIPPGDDGRNLIVRFYNFPKKTPIKSLTSERINTFVSVEGLVKNATKTLPKITVACFKCACGRNVYLDIDRTMDRPDKTDCLCGRGKYKFVPERSKVSDCQYITIQEPPEGNTSGGLPSTILVEAREDLCNKVVPGNRVVVCGELKAFPLKNTNSLMEPEISASSLEKLEKEYDDISISEEELRRIIAMSRDPHIFTRLASNIAPTVLGHGSIKKSILLQLFGGFSKTLADGTRTRGDIHILLCGDPGVAKSQILKSIVMLSPRAVMASGTLSSAAGLTATVVKDANNQWSLEAGAVVLADKAMLVIDEIDKMRDEDRAAMHTAMEQQEIYISKAGINSTLYTRCSILAAANPKHGRFDMYSDLAEQVDLPPTLLSRFDMIFLLIDSPNADKDRDIANFILNRSEKSEYDINIIRKYIAYSRQNIFPIINDKAKSILVEYYTKMRGMGGRDKPMPITARQLEALSRLAEASARSRLSNEVNEEDAVRVIELMVECLKGVAFDPTSGTFDIDKSTFMSKKSRDVVHELLEVIKSFNTERGSKVDDVIVEMLSRKEMKREKVEQMIDQLLREGRLISPRNGWVKVV